MTTAAMRIPLGGQPADDAGLLAAVARDEPGAFERFVAAYQARVTRLAHRLLGWRADVDDVVQDVFFAAFRNASRFRGGSSLWTWLTVITVNHCRTHQRRLRFRWRLHGDAPAADTTAAPAADQPHVDDETAAAVRAAVAALPPTDREVIVLHYLEQRPIVEIGELLGRSRNAVEVRLHRARAKLREALAQLNKD